jgi:hypothetical protein
VKAILFATLESVENILILISVFAARICYASIYGELTKQEMKFSDVLSGHIMVANE